MPDVTGWQQALASGDPRARIWWRAHNRYSIGLGVTAQRPLKNPAARYADRPVNGISAR